MRPDNIPLYMYVKKITVQISEIIPKEFVCTKALMCTTVCVAIQNACRITVFVALQNACHFDRTKFNILTYDLKIVHHHHIQGL
jgi:hypothetical protein